MLSARCRTTTFGSFKWSASHWVLTSISERTLSEFVAPAVCRLGHDATARSTITTKLKRGRSEAVFFIDFSFRFAHHLRAHFPVHIGIHQSVRLAGWSQWVDATPSDISLLSKGGVA